MKKFDLFIVGAQKSGTTALAKFLNEHPEITVPQEKELHILDKLESDQLIIAEYDRHLTNKNSIYCDATPIYSFFPGCIEKLYKYNSNAKLIFIIRDPTERAISNYYMEKRNGREKLPILIAMLVEPFRIKLIGMISKKYKINALIHKSYVSRSKYCEQIIKIRKFFSQNQLLIVRQKDLLTQHENTMRDIYDFIGLDNKNFIAKSEKIFTGDYKNNGHRFVRMYLDIKLTEDKKFYNSLVLNV